MFESCVLLSMTCVTLSQNVALSGAVLGQPPTVSKYGVYAFLVSYSNSQTGVVHVNEFEMLAKYVCMPVMENVALST